MTPKSSSLHFPLLCTCSKTEQNKTKKNKKASPKNVLDEAAKVMLWILLNLTPSGHVLLIFCVMKMGNMSKAFLMSTKVQ